MRSRRANRWGEGREGGVGIGRHLAHLLLADPNQQAERKRRRAAGADPQSFCEFLSEMCCSKNEEIQAGPSALSEGISADMAVARKSMHTFEMVSERAACVAKRACGRMSMRVWSNAYEREASALGSPSTAGRLCLTDCAR